LAENRASLFVSTKIAFVTETTSTPLQLKLELFSGSRCEPKEAAYASSANSSEHFKPGLRTLQRYCSFEPEVGI
jgi:hypothetical protein